MIIEAKLSIEDVDEQDHAGVMSRDEVPVI